MKLLSAMGKGSTVFSFSSEEFYVLKYTPLNLCSLQEYNNCELGSADILACF